MDRMNSSGHMLHPGVTSDGNDYRLLQTFRLTDCLCARVFRTLNRIILFSWHASGLWLTRPPAAPDICRVTCKRRLSRATAFLERDAVVYRVARVKGSRNARASAWAGEGGKTRKRWGRVS